MSCSPQSEAVFEIPEIGARITFHREESGEMNRFTFAQSGEESPGERLERTEPTAEATRQYVGDYYSPELGTFYTVVLENDHLTARHRRRGKIELTPTTGDEFTGDAWYFGKARFERDEDGNVVMMRVSSGRVRDVRFERVADTDE